MDKPICLYEKIMTKSIWSNDIQCDSPTCDGLVRALFPTTKNGNKPPVVNRLPYLVLADALEEWRPGLLTTKIISHDRAVRRTWSDFNGPAADLSFRCLSGDTEEVLVFRSNAKILLRTAILEHVTRPLSGQSESVLGWWGCVLSPWYRPGYAKYINRNRRIEILVPGA